MPPPSFVSRFRLVVSAAARALARRPGRSPPSDAPHTPHAEGRGGLCRLRLRRPRRLLPSVVAPRPSDRRQGIEEPEPSGCAKDLPSGGAFDAPPYPPAPGAQGGRSASPPWCSFFFAGGAAGKDSTARVVGKASLRRFAALPSFLAAQKRQEAPRPLPAKKNGGRGARHGPSLGAAKTREG